MVYSKSVIFDVYEDFVEEICVRGVGRNVVGVVFVFRPFDRCLCVCYEVRGCDGLDLVEEFDGFGLTSFKDLLSVVNKCKDRTSEVVPVRVVMEC